MSRLSRLRRNKGRSILVIAAAALSLAVHIKILRSPSAEAELPEVSAAMNHPNAGDIHNRRDAAQEEDPAAASRPRPVTRETDPTLVFELGEGANSEESSANRDGRPRDNSTRQAEDRAGEVSQGDGGNPNIPLFRDGNRIEVVGVNVNNPKMFEAGMAILYIRFDDGDERAVFVERSRGMLVPTVMEDVKEQYGDSILFFGDAAEKSRKIRGVGLDPNVVNSGVLLGKRSILSMSTVLKEHGIDSDVIRNKSIRFNFDNRTGGFSLVSVHQIK